MERKELNLEKARSHMSVTAAGLAHTLGPADAAGTLVGAAVGILTAEFGAEAASQYLREIAFEIEDDGPEAPRHGHA